MEKFGLEVEFEGYPFYIESVVTGGPLSDFGSHYGIKASLTDKKFAKTANYTCLPGMGGMFSNTWITLNEELPEDRKVFFYPFYIKEKAVFNNSEVIAKTFFISTDTLLIAVDTEKKAKVSLVVDRTNTSAQEYMIDESVVCDICPHPLVIKDSLPVDHATLRAERFREKAPTEYGDEIEVTEEAFEEFKKSPLGKENTVHRAFYPSFDFKVRENKIESKEPTGSFFIIISFSDAESGAIKLAKEGHQKAAGRGKDRLFEEIKKDWNSFLDSINLKGNVKKYKILLEEALTALRMNLYAPRNKMQYYCSVPCKIHFNYFWGWDTAFHALGINHFNSDLAVENLLTQFAGMKPDGMLCSMIDDSLTPSSDISQPPAQAWAIDEIYKKTGDLDFLQNMYLKSKDYLKWFYKERDLDEGGLYEFHTAGETGWDDTPRFLGVREGITIGTRITSIDTIDLNSWLHFYLTKMAGWAKILGKDKENKRWELGAERLKKSIDRYMWSEADGCWFDIRRVDGRHEKVKVLTPAVWFPAWLNATDDKAKVKRVIEEHLLNPEEFFGKYPIPSVAYNSPFYDKREKGCYWQGQIWLVTAYSAYDTLKKHGYKKEALDLKRRLLSMMSTPEKGGIHENYNALTGEVGCTGHAGKPALSQFGWSSTFVIEMLTDELC